MVHFVALVYSPWSEKARWALDHHRVPYREIPYMPLVGEISERVRRRRLAGPVTAPILRGPGVYVEDSFAIARYAESVGSGSALIPAHAQEQVTAFNKLSERGLAAGRALALPRIARSQEARQQLIPRPLRDRLGQLALPLVGASLAVTMRKYRVDARPDVHEAALCEVLDQVRATLTRGGDQQADTLLDQFSYADIAIAQVLQFVAPKSIGGFRITDAARQSFMDPYLAERYPDLVTWRDHLYARHWVAAA